MLKTVNTPKQDKVVMPKFNKVIQMEVDVDNIHDKLLSTFPEDYKHKEILAHAIIGTAMNSKSISYVYNALHGYSNDIDFKIGDNINCKSKLRRVYVPSTTEAKAERIMVEISNCEIVDIDLYSGNKIKVRFEQDGYEGEKEMTTVWVNHKDCAKWSDENPELVVSLD